MTIAFQDGFTDSSIDSIVRWLFVDTYKPLYFEGKEDKVYMAIPIGESSIAHNGLKQGYFTINMRCDSPNVYSPLTESPIYTVVGSKTITVNNGGHFDVFPEISIVKNGSGTITLQNVDDVGNIFEVRDLTNGEDLYINCEKEIIETDIVGMYRYDNIIGEFPRLVYGDNRFVVTGSCTIQFRYKNKYRF
jgi:phage-related protein